MVRTNPALPGRFTAYLNLPRFQREAMRDAPNPDFGVRYAKFQERSIIAERGINLHDIPDPRAVEIALERGWSEYARNPGYYDPELVREFYASMIPGVFNEFYTVHVRGRVVHMPMEAICNHFEVVRPQNLGLTFGVSPIPGVGPNDKHSSIIASSLRMNGNGTWQPRVNEIKKSELPASLAIWFVFIKASLVPSMHFTNVDYYVAKLLYCIQHNMPLDIGHIIQLQMLDAAADQSTSLLPFPCLITAFCRDAGINVNATERPQKMIDRHTYQKHMATVHGNNEEEEEDDYEAPQPQPQQRPRRQARGRQPQPPHDFASLATHIDSGFANLRMYVDERFSAVDERFNTVDTNIENLRREVRGQQPMDEAGPSQARRTRGRQGESSSRRRGRDE